MRETASLNVLRCQEKIQLSIARDFKRFSYGRNVLCFGQCTLVATGFNEQKIVTKLLMVLSQIVTKLLMGLRQFLISRNTYK